MEEKCGKYTSFSRKYRLVHETIYSVDIHECVLILWMTIQYRCGQDSCTGTCTYNVPNIDLFPQTLDLLERVYSGRGYKCVRLDGSTPSSKRFQLVEHLNSQHSPQSNVITIHDQINELQLLLRTDVYHTGLDVKMEISMCYMYMYMYMIKINEPQLPWLRTAIYHTRGLDVKMEVTQCTCTCYGGLNIITHNNSTHAEGSLRMRLLYMHICGSTCT